jgi:tRNA pseudouridine55 synthase
MDGILNVNKPAGMTSHDVVDFLRRLTGVKKAGHTGTLDPEATGVLAVCLGKATRVIRYLPGDKSYRAEVTFGVTTDTQDTSGRVLETADASFLSEEALLAALSFFRGRIWQVPPMFSALRRQGKRLYDLARKGIEVDREPRPVDIYDLRLVAVRGLGTSAPVATLELTCSAGTYVRSLCADLGKKLGCGAAMSALVRTRAGPFSLEKSLSLEEAASLHERGRLADALVDLNGALAHLPPVELKPGAAGAVRDGARIYAAGVHGFPGVLAGGEEGGPVRLLFERRLLAVARRYKEPGGKDYFQPETVLC